MANPNEVDSVLADEQQGTIDPGENQDLEVVPISAVDESVRLEQTGCDNASSVIPEKTVVRLEGKCIQRRFDEIQISCMLPRTI